MLPCGMWAGNRAGHPARGTPLTIVPESSHLTIQGFQVFGQLLDSREHFRITWNPPRGAVGTGQGPSLGPPCPPTTSRPVEGRGGLTCFEFLQLFLQLALQR